MRPPRPQSRSSAVPAHPDDLVVEIETAVGEAEVSSDLLAHVARRLIELSEENAQLKQAIESRPVVDQARGVLIAVLGADEDEAWEVLLDASQHANIPLRHVAEALLASAAGRPLPPDLRVPLRRAMSKVRWGTGDKKKREG
ncbi:ANTAR domain-containing protein [Streptomyces sp. WMMC500]|uniref:ANTAR domain-containing protein n=1 Tax=Streptomyces sp. WMMC500 TaxID=3015154 RepID=UPI00248BA8B6|nr:ANTAR domain-containing protein [Streptomyces sp. WMMC500]WBB61746.1 ANTAR domain-containing protein [Streptomyces sp. WMMC500]